MIYAMYDQGYAIILEREDGKSVCLQGDDAMYFRADWQDENHGHLSIGQFIEHLGYDVLFEGA